MKKTYKLVVANLSKSFVKPDDGLLKIISNLSFHVFKNEIISIIGPSGCGKTTLFHIISGIESQDQGTILIDGKLKEKRQ